MSATQTEALERLGPRWLVPVTAQAFDAEQVFGRSAPLILEVGCGMGATTVEQAVADPHSDVLAVDVHTPGIGNLLALVEQEQLMNVRAIHGDAVEVIDRMLPQESLSGFRSYFPDPWPKMKHRNRRLIQREFVDLLVPRLRPGAFIHCATDVHDYAEQMVRVLGSHPDLENPFGGLAPRPADRPITKFEGRAIAAGHQISEVWVTRRLKP
jgi:tRNA (guanine-N7-)-methyltransferase